MLAMAVNRETIIQRSLSGWWSEETEYMFQRIERWAAFARGYNRLQSQRWSKDRLMAQERQDSSGLAKRSVEETNHMPRFYCIEQPRRKSRSEETRINCCGTFNYQSNSKLDNNCLNAYRYDHSIYFKTIGDIRNNKINGELVENDDDDRMSISSNEHQEVDISSLIDPLADEIISEETRDNNHPESLNVSITERKTNRETRNTWPIVDLAKLNLDVMEIPRSRSIDEKDNRERDEIQQRKDSSGVKNMEMESADNETWKNKEDDRSKGHQKVKRSRSFRKVRRSSRNVRKS